MARGTEPLNCVEMLGCRVSFVGFPAIAGMPHGQPVHEVVAQHFGDDRGCRDRMAARVSVHDGLVLAAQLGTRQAIDENVRRREAEPVQCALHGEDRRPANVQAVDFTHARGADGDGKCPLADLRDEPLPLRSGEHLGVVETANRLDAHRKHDGRGDHWTGQWTAADFVNPGDADSSFTPQRRLAFQRRAAASHACDCSCSSVSGTVIPCAPAALPRFSRMRAALPARRRRKYSLARRTRPLRVRPISAIDGACSGKIRATPTPAEIFQTVKVSFTPPPRRAMQMPSNAWRRSFSPSRTRTMTRSVSPGAKAGMSVFSPSRSTARNFSITTLHVATRDPAAVRASGVRLAPPAMPQSCRGRHSTIRPGRRARDSSAAAYSWAAPAVLHNANRSMPIHDLRSRQAGAAPPHRSHTARRAHRPTARNRRSTLLLRPTRPRRADRRPYNARTATSTPPPPHIVPRAHA